MTYPLGLNLSGRRVLVVGAGPVAARRVPALLTEGAAVELVAPGAHEDLRALAEAGELTWHRRGFRPEDVAGAWLVLAHTDSPAVQDLVTRTAEQHRVFCVTGGDAAASSAWVPGRDAGPRGHRGRQRGRGPTACQGRHRVDRGTPGDRGDPGQGAALAGGRLVARRDRRARTPQLRGPLPAPRRPCGAGSPH